MGGGGSGWWGQGGCEPRIEVFVKISKKKIFFFCGGGVGGLGRGGGGEGSGWRGQGGCERRIEVFGKIYTKKIREGVGSWGGDQVGGRVGGGGDVNEELKFL